MDPTSPITCFWTEPTGRIRTWLRRYSSRFERPGESLSCPGPDGYHNANVLLGDEVRTDPPRALGDNWDHTDPRWPLKCDGCDYCFEPSDQWQWTCEAIYRRPDTGAEYLLSELPPGAMYDAHWYPEHWKGADGIALVVITPPHHPWHVDSRCTNCGRPDDNVHKCWCRHGDPRTGKVTVDKNCDTCPAGAGSIQTPHWHGMLQDGILRPR